MALQQQRSLQLRRKGGPPLGLKNLGNTCYLNSVLQCLSFTPPLAQFCLSSQHSSLCKSLFPNRDKECPFCILERQIARCLSLDGSVDAPSKIQKCLALFAEHFRWGRQEDAHEFLRYVIDACHNTCLKLIKRLNAAPKTAATAAAPDAGPDTVMKEIFGGALLSQVKCLSCKGESNKTDEIMDISLDLYQSNSVKEALTRFFQPEVLEGSNKYVCEKCKKLSVAKKQLFMLRAPSVLVIQLKRFECSGKINRNIEFEEVLALSKFIYNASQDSQPEYNLFGSIVHSGFSPESGHYYAYIKDAGRWYCCNDAYVSLSSTQEVLSEKVYILFYLRNNQSPRLSKINSPCSGLKPPDSNGNGISPSVKLNGVLSSKTNGSTMLKNGKISQNPQIMSTPKNLELKRVVQNGNGNLVVHNGASVEKFSDFGQSKRHKILPECSSNGSNMLHREQGPPAANDITSNGNASSDMKEHCKKQELLVSNGIECDHLLKVVDEDIGNQVVATMKKEPGCDHASNHMIKDGIGYKNLLKVEVDEDIGNQVVAAVKMEPNGDHSSNHIISKYNSGISHSKRKSCDAERGEVQVLGFNQSSNLSTNNVSCTRSTNQRKHTPEELEKFKEELARLAYSDLQSCDWVNKVHNFMRIRKRLCKQATGSCLDSHGLRKQLINDAKNTFTSQVPEPLKEYLIELLRSFHQGKYISDS